MKSALQIGDAAAVDLDGALDKRHPAQALLGRAPARATPDRITACGKVTADGLNRVRVQAEFLASASAELHQVKGRGPLTLPFHGVALRPATMVPDEVASTRVAQQMPSGRGVLDAVAYARVRALRHCVCSLYAHLVFVCKYPRDVRPELAIADLREIFSEVCTDLGATLVECSGEDDHIHLLVEYPPSRALSWLVKNLKGRSSRLLREYGPEVHGRYRSALWTPAYFVASCGGARSASPICAAAKRGRGSASG